MATDQSLWLRSLRRLGSFAVGLFGALILMVAVTGTPEASADHDRTNNNNWLYGWSQAAFAQFDSKSSSMSSSVDWPVKLIFTNNASINGVKSGLCNSSPYGGTTGPYCAVGLSKSMQLWTTSGWPDWDTDWGIKTGTGIYNGNGASCDGTWVEHMRLYAPTSTDQFYNPALGYFIVATTHLDRDDAPWCANPMYGHSDVAAWWFRNGIAANTAWPIAQDIYSLNHGTTYHSCWDPGTGCVPSYSGHNVFYSYNDRVSRITVN